MSKENLSDLEQLAEINKRQKLALTAALDSQKNRKGFYFAQKINMGSYQGTKRLIPSYVTVQTLGFVSKNIKMGSEMPFMRDKIDSKTNRLIVDQDNIDDVMQRAPDWTRQLELTHYLLRSNHKFTSILAVIQPNWINVPESSNWGDDGRALKDAIDFEPLDSSSSIGLLNLEDKTIFALDGQHRIMGIKGIEALSNGQLKYLNKNGSENKKGGMIDTEVFLSKFKVTRAHLDTILNSETLSIEFVPAVVHGETREEARIRLRNYFTDVNTYAKKIKKGEEAMLDETDGFKIVGRKVGLSHSLFQSNDDKAPSRINMTDQSIPKESNWITTLEAITNISENYLSAIDSDRREAWGPLFKEVKIRPPEGEIKKGMKELSKFFDLMSEIDVFKKLQRGESIKYLREFPEKDPKKKSYEKTKDYLGHLLLRPIGQQILAQAVGELVGKGGNVEDIFNQIKKIEQKGHFSTHNPSSIFFGVTIDLGAKRMITSYQDAAADYLKYLVKGGSAEDQKKIYEQIKLRRTDELSPGKWINFQGERADLEDDDYLSLPKPVGV
tara:strand:- start:501 stop:2162 length:1662 start_codon:yes stop_codon:yes gene_type:complete